MSLVRNSCYGLLVTAMLAGIAAGEPRMLMARLGEEGDAPASGATSLSLVPGETATVLVWVFETSASSIGGYQIAIPGFATPGAGAGGSVDYVDTAGPGGSVTIDTSHPRWLFQAVPGITVVFSETGLPDGFAFIAAAPLGVGISASFAYFGQFDIMASADACGVFTLEFLPNGAPPNGGTAVTGDQGGEVPIAHQPLEITVDAICPGEPRAFMVRAGEHLQAPVDGPTKLTMDPGETVDIETWLADTAPQVLGSYQVAIPGTATAGPDGGGTIEYVDTAGPGGSVVINNARPDWALAGVAGVQIFYSETGLPQGFAMLAGGPLGAGAQVTLGYLGEFQFVASADACGTFTLDYLPNGAPPNGGTAFIDDTGEGAVNAALRQLVINVNAVCGPTEEACCFDDGSCSDLNPDTCSAQGGTPQGSGSDCATTECPLPPEACCFPEGNCVDLTAADCDGQGGTTQGAGTSCAVEGCPEAPVIVHATGQPGETQPCSGYVDPKRESSDCVNVNLGLDEITLVFSMPVFSIGGGPVGPADFVMSETGGATPPGVASVDASGNPLVVVTFDRPITLLEWTTTRAVVQNAGGVHITNMGDLGGGVNEPDRHDVALLPCDVNQDENCGPFDLLTFRQYVNEVSAPPCGVLMDYLDIDRTNTIGPFDLLAFRQLVNGICPATRPWANTDMNNSRP